MAESQQKPPTDEWLRAFARDLMQLRLEYGLDEPIEDEDAA